MWKFEMFSPTICGWTKQLHLEFNTVKISVLPLQFAGIRYNTGVNNLENS